MGRLKSECPFGNFIVRTKPNAKGEVAIYLIYYINGVPVTRSTAVLPKLVLAQMPAAHTPPQK
ncbi:hypothetical protein [Alistipes sp.]|uniref:hypothetical protein n=1 Tax=Alistipes sp. TaxID=1872444 RepID=UPI003AF8C63A